MKIPTARPVVSVLFLLSASCLALSQSGGPATADYALLDNVEGPIVFLNAAPVRPLALDGNGDLWAVNTANNTVERFSGSNPDPVDVFAVPWGPVSVATWVPDQGNPELLVVCRNTWALARLDAVTGDLLAVVPLDAEPSDILVDTEDRAFVSCMGGDSVLQIDLTQYGSQPARRYHESTHPAFRCKSPLFLSLSEQGQVLVAPMHSGNNSTAAGAPTTNVPIGQSMEDLDDDVLQLPDEDLFAINPDNGPQGTVTVVAKATGTILFGQGINPVTGDLWQLHTEANNKDPNLQNEPLVRGQFAFNRISVVTAPFATPATISLDPSGVLPGGKAVAQPYALTFRQDGRALVTGLGTDNVVVLNSDGTLYKEWDLPPGSIPRGIVLNAAGTVAAVYCHGTAEIRAYRVENDPPTLLVTFQLSHDPTPPNLVEGRAIFFDASNSAEGNLSCATCHVDGGTDLLTWNLSNGDKDDKGPMLTQTLVGLERVEPFHWRGERELVDFNPAFVGLLGHDAPLADEEFARMQDFLLSLKNPANPFQNRARVVDSSIHAISDDSDAASGNAIEGQEAFQTAITVQNGFTCVDCHEFPVGTINGILRDFAPVGLPERTHFKVGPFHELWRRQQSTVPLGGVLASRAFLGSGTSHSGKVEDIFHFEDIIDEGLAPDIATFVHQWDQGLAPAVHHSFLLNAQSAGAANTELVQYLIPQAAARNCDVAVMGTVQVGGAPLRVRWFYDRYAGQSPFIPDNPSLAPRSLADFLTGASQESNLFLGLPVGMAERFAINHDMDLLRNAVDPAPYVPGPLDATDVTAPAFVAGPTVAWRTNRAARLWLDSNEPATVEVTYQEQGLPQTARTVTSDLLGRNHALMLTGLRASTAQAGLSGAFPAETVIYDVEVTIRDRNGKPTTTSLAFPTKPFTLPSANFDPATDQPDYELLHAHVLSDLALSLEEVEEGTVRALVTADVAFKQGGGPPAPRRVLVGRVFVTPAGQHVAQLHDDVTAGWRSIVVDQVALSQGLRQLAGLDGPFVVNTLLSNANGQVGMRFDVTSVNPGDTIAFNVEAVLEIHDVQAFNDALAAVDCPTNCGLILPVLSNRFSQWDFPSSKEANTCVEAVY